MTALFMACGWLLGGEGGMIVALAIAAVMNLFAWWNSDKIVLRMYRAQEVGPDHPAGHSLHAMVSQLARNADLPMPKVYIVENDQPNALSIEPFAASPRRSRARQANLKFRMRSPSGSQLMA